MSCKAHTHTHTHAPVTYLSLLCFGRFGQSGRRHVGAADGLDLFHGAELGLVKEL